MSDVPFVFKDLLQTKAEVASGSFNRDSILASPHRLSILLQPSCFEQTAKSSPAATLNSTNFGQIDFLLVGTEWLHKISGVASCMDMPLASHHFPVIAEIDVDLPRAIATTSRDPRFHLCELQSGPTSSLFATFFHECMLQCDCENGTADELCSAMATSFQQSAGRCLHQTKRQAHKLWISSRTLHLLEERGQARASRNPHLEKQLHGQVKQSVKIDRSQWFDDFLKTGDWNDIRRLRRGHRPRSGRLKNTDGNVVESDQRAETLATCFETVQWAPRATTEPPQPTCVDPLLASNTSISEAEVVESVKSLKRRKAAGADGTFPNFGRLYVHTIHQHVDGPSFCATRLGKKAPYQHLGMKLLWRLSSKKGIPLVVKIIGLFHCLQSVTKYLQQFCYEG